ncbi:MAG TPA: hypothetical protein VKA61_04040 [Sphingomicrobium sp.]|nr:hypothetical protein [Sphingomicrobium sp.]
MHKGLGFFAAGLASLAMLGGAQAKMVRYEINGQRYSYNTNNREQVEEARRRIAAANAAYAAWLKAQAERASNPLARVLGSPSASGAPLFGALAAGNATRRVDRHRAASRDLRGPRRRTHARRIVQQASRVQSTTTLAPT